MLTVQVVLYHFSEQRIEIEEHKTQKPSQYILNIHQTNTVKDLGLKVTQYVSDTKEISTQENPILIIAGKIQKHNRPLLRLIVTYSSM